MAYPRLESLYLTGKLRLRLKSKTARGKFAVEKVENNILKELDPLFIANCVAQVKNHVRLHRQYKVGWHEIIKHKITKIYS